MGGYDRETVDLMTGAIEMAWRELKLNEASKETQLEAIHGAMVRRIMAAVRNGERDPARLKMAALRAVQEP